MYAREEADGLRGLVVAVCAPDGVADAAARLEAEFVGRGASVLGPAPVDAGRDVSGGLSLEEQMRVETVDRLVVADVGGRVDEGCAGEIGYALSVACPVQFLEPVVRMGLDPDLYEAMKPWAEGGATVHVRLADGKREVLGPGTVISFARRGGARDETVLCRVTGVERLAHRAALLATVHPGAVLPGSDLAGLGARLEEIYPGAGGRERLAIHLQYLGHRDPVGERDRAVGRVQALSRHYAAILITNQDQEVLLVKWTGVLDWQLPGHTALTSPDEELDVTCALARDLGAGAGAIGPARLLVTDLSLTSRGRVTELVLDGGVLSREQASAITTHPGGNGGSAAGDEGEVECRAFVPAGQAHALLAPGLVRRVTGAHRRLTDESAPARLTHGYAPGTRPVWTWHQDAALPEGVPVLQATVFAFDPDDGRVLLRHSIYQHYYAVPGGSLQPCDGGDPLTAATRQAYQESKIVIAAAIMIGYRSTRSDPAYPDGLVQVRYAAPIVCYDQATVDQDPERPVPDRPCRRFLCDIRSAGDLLDDGPTIYAEAKAAARAARIFQIPVDRPASDGYLDHAHIPTRGNR